MISIRKSAMTKRFYWKQVAQAEERVKQSIAWGGPCQARLANPTGFAPHLRGKIVIKMTPEAI